MIVSMAIRILHPIIKKIVDAREIKKQNEETGFDFFNLSYDALSKPNLLNDMEKACMRISDAIKNNEQIGIYADYDADGIPAAALLFDFFKTIQYSPHIHIYIPNRHEFGYGIHTHGIDFFS